jgi:hypothetical protein
MRRKSLGSADVTVLVFVPDPASTDGSGKTGLNAVDLECAFTRVETDNDVVMTDVTSSLNNIALTDVHTDWGWEEVSSTLSPGLYRLDIADAVFASGAVEAVVYVQIASSDAAASPMIFELVDTAAATLGVNVVSAAGTAWASGAITAASIATDAIGAAEIADGAITAATFAAGAIDATAIANNAIDAATFAADVDAEILSYIVDDATKIDASALNTATGTTIPAILADTAEIGVAGAGLTAINLPDQTMDITGNITGNLSGSVGSVTGLTAANLDATISSRASQVSVDDLPTNAELATALGTADDAVLAQIALVKAKTDSLTFTTANQVDANIQSVNDVAVSGTGAVGDEWGP